MTFYQPCHGARPSCSCWVKVIPSRKHLRQRQVPGREQYVSNVELAAQVKQQQTMSLSCGRLQRKGEQQGLTGSQGRTNRLLEWQEVRGQMGACRESTVTLYTSFLLQHWTTGFLYMIAGTPRRSRRNITSFDDIIIWGWKVRDARPSCCYNFHASQI